MGIDLFLVPPSSKTLTRRWNTHPGGGVWHRRLLRAGQWARLGSARSHTTDWGEQAGFSTALGWAGMDGGGDAMGAGEYWATLCALIALTVADTVLCTVNLYYYTDT